MATKNANDGLSMIATVENATNDVTDMLQRVRELAVQAANDTNSATDRGYLQKEVDSLLNEINRVASQTVYNGATVLDGTRTSQKIQVGTDSGQSISFSVASVDTDTLGLTGSASAVKAEDTIAYAAFDTLLEAAAVDAPVVLSFAGTTLNFTVEATGDTAGKISKTADVDTVLADITNHADYASANFTVAKDGANLTLTAKTGGENAVRATSKVAANAAVDATQKTAGANVGATSGAFTAGSTPSVISTTASDNLVTSTGSAQDPAVGADSVLGLSVLTAKDAEAALTRISAAIEQVAGERASLGAVSNRLEYTASNLMNVAEYTTAARSRIEDADFAAESARLAKAQVLQQTGTAMLAQANASQQLALSLFR
jgi:flagellin